MPATVALYLQGNKNPTSEELLINMTKSAELRHIKNIDNLQALLDHCLSANIPFNTSTPFFNLRSLNTHIAAARAVLSDIRTYCPAYEKAVMERMQLFGGLPSLVSDVIHAAALSDVGSERLKQLKSVYSNIRTTKPPIPVRTIYKKTSLLPFMNETFNQSEESFEKRIRLFEKLLTLLGTLNNYFPASPAVQLSHLKQHRMAMAHAHQKVVDALIPLKNACTLRNRLIYEPGTGIADIGTEMKAYLRDQFGKKSAEYLPVAGLKFYQTL